MRSPETTAVILLDGIRQFYSQLWETGELLLQPRRKVLAEAAGIDKVRLDFSVLEKIGFDRNSIHFH
jgi:hypothetical protein